MNAVIILRVRFLTGVPVCDNKLQLFTSSRVKSVEEDLSLQASNSFVPTQIWRMVAQEAQNE